MVVVFISVVSVEFIFLLIYLFYWMLIIIVIIYNRIIIEHSRASYYLLHQASERMSRSSTMDTEWRRLERIMWVIVGLLATKNCVCVYSGLIISVLLASSYYIIIIISTSSSSSYLLFLTSMILRGARLESQACVNADTAPPPIVLPCYYWIPLHHFWRLGWPRPS